MKDMEEGTLKDLGFGQKSLFDYAECRELREGPLEGMPSWFWKLARECKAEVSS